MPFKQVFERRVNSNMQEEEAGPAPREEAVEDHDMKKAHDEKQPQWEEEDIELSGKKDRPPRFSTLFEGAPAPQIIERIVEPRKKSGVYIPTPLFIVLAIALFFESTLLFAYTIIGLYNNLPYGVLPFGKSSSSTVEGCNCSDGQAGINIAPNFYLPGAKEAVTLSGSSVMSSSSSSSSTSSSTTNNSKYLASLLAGLTTSTSATSDPAVASTTLVVTSTPTRKIVSVTIDQTIVAGQSTVTSITNVPPKSSTNAKRASPASDSASADDGEQTEAATTPSTLVTSTSLPPTTKAPSPTKKNDHKPTTTTTSDGSDGGACFGAGGAVWQNCIDKR
jgi:hypothetical protein